MKYNATAKYWGVADKNKTGIYGIGESPNEAKYDLYNWSHNDYSPHEIDEKIEYGDYVIEPLSPALAQYVIDHGGDVAYRKLNNQLVLLDEIEIE